MKITSVNNELIKETAKLLKNKYREETSLFLYCIIDGILFILSFSLLHFPVIDNFKKFIKES